MAVSRGHNLPGPPYQHVISHLFKLYKECVKITISGCYKTDVFFPYWALSHQFIRICLLDGYYVYPLSVIGRFSRFQIFRFRISVEQEIIVFHHKPHELYPRLVCQTRLTGCGSSYSYLPTVIFSLTQSNLWGKGGFVFCWQRFSQVHLFCQMTLRCFVETLLMVSYSGT